MTRSEFENLTKEFIDKSIEATKQTLKDSGIDIKDIQEVVLVGGQIRMPKIQEEIKSLFGKEPHKGINPDEVVAMGAAVQAGILQGDVKDVLLLDVTPLSLGIETMGQVNTILISKNTTVPTSKTQIFSTAVDNQPSVEIHILQGERPSSADNKTLGRFILDGIPPSPRGVPQIEVSFDIDANGILNVSAKDKASGKTQSVRIEGSCGVSDEEVEKMKKDAELHAEEDQKKKETIEVKNLADNLIYTTEKTLKDAGDKVSAEIKKEVEEKMEELKKVKDSDDIEDIKKKTDELSQAIQKVGAQMYQQAQPQTPPTGEQPQDNTPPQEGQQEGQQDGQTEDKDDKQSDDKNAEEGEYKEK
jgi:molecular chaperone DnaK